MKTTDSRFGACLYFASNALARKVEKLALECWKPVGLSPSHAYLLIAVLHEPGIQPMQLAGELQLQPSTITRLIEKLETLKLVQRTTEGKITNVYPTPKAKALLPRLQQCQQYFQSQCTEIFGAQSGKQFISEMGRIADKF